MADHEELTDYVVKTCLERLRTPLEWRTWGEAWLSRKASLQDCIAAETIGAKLLWVDADLSYTLRYAARAAWAVFMVNDAQLEWEHLRVRYGERPSPKDYVKVVEAQSTLKYYQWECQRRAEESLRLLKVLKARTK